MANSDSSLSYIYCPYCESTMLREDRLEEHTRRIHPGIRRPRRLPVAKKNPPPNSPKKPVPPQRLKPSPADSEAVERLKQLAKMLQAAPSPETAAVHSRLDYIVKVGRPLVTRAFSLTEQSILFTGDGPYEAHRLSRLLPDEAKICVDGEDPERNLFGVVVVGRQDFYGDRMRRAVTNGHRMPHFIPQEGFLDELLFGRNWWTEEIDLLNMTLINHPGLKYAKSLENLPIFRRHADPEKRFRWPSTEAQEAKKHVQEGYGYRDSTPLFNLGYRTTGMDRARRWEVLTRKALPKLGLREVAETIAGLCRARKRQNDGRLRYADAIGEWEHDLARLKREYYDARRGGFTWPSTER